MEHEAQLNALLALIGPEDFALLAPHLERLFLHKGTTLFTPDKTALWMYAPISCTIAVYIDLIDGFSIEAFMHGHLCLAGVGASTGGVFYRAEVRESGWAYRFPARLWTEACLRGGDALRAALAGQRNIMLQMARNIACMKHHSIEQQVIRWLLTWRERSRTPTLHITHNELAQSLGSRREAVTLALNRLESQGCLSLGRAHLTLLDEDWLRQHVCECHAIGRLPFESKMQM